MEMDERNKFGVFTKVLVSRNPMKPCIWSSLFW